MEKTLEIIASRMEELVMELNDTPSQTQKFHNITVRMSELVEIKDRLLLLNPQ